MTKYSQDFNLPSMFPPQIHTNVLSEWLSVMKKTQCHIAETEKYAHVTFFFNGGREERFEGEERVLISSPKVATYDLKPEMSVFEVSDAVCQSISSGKFDFVMCNLAPPDMVGHTGKYEETVVAVEATGMLSFFIKIDEAIGSIMKSCSDNGWTLLVTADHGNAEKMLNENGQPHTAHTCAPVPFVCSDKKIQLQQPSGRKAALCDVAPTILDILNVSIPKEMTGQSLM